MRITACAIVFLGVLAATFRIAGGFSAAAAEPGLAQREAGPVGAVRPFAPQFYAFENGVRFASPEEGAQILQELGYDGMGSASPHRLPQWLKALDQAGLRLFSIYVAAEIRSDGVSYDPAIPDAIRLLQDRDAVVELTLQGDAPDADAKAVRVVREIADMAAQAGLRIALYPHHGFYVSRVDEALRIAQRAQRDNVGIMLNLCHFLRCEEAGDLEAAVARAAPYLVQVSICGADRDGQDWSSLIQTLDRGTFDQLQLLRLLRQHNFPGRVGLQCYSVPGDATENLERSIGAWQRLMRQLANELRDD